MSFVSYKWKWGAINSTGKQIIPFKYEAHGDFSEGMAAVQLNKKWGYVKAQQQAKQSQFQKKRWRSKIKMEL